MSDSVKAWHEMQQEKLASLKADEAIAKVISDQGGEYYVQQTSQLSIYGY